MSSTHYTVANGPDISPLGGLVVDFTHDERSIAAFQSAPLELVLAVHDGAASGNLDLWFKVVCQHLNPVLGATRRWTLPLPKPVRRRTVGVGTLGSQPELAGCNNTVYYLCQRSVLMQQTVLKILSQSVVTRSGTICL